MTQKFGFLIFDRARVLVVALSVVLKIPLGYGLDLLSHGSVCQR